MSILISGSSIAGLAAAQRFGARGADVTVVERARALRRQGAPIDVRGAALDVAEDMGIRGLLTACETGQLDRSAFAHFVDADGEVVGAVPDDMPRDRVDDLEVFRTDLIDALHGALGPNVKIIYEDSIRDLNDTGERVDVTFASGGTGSYELVIGADGIHSNTRRLVFGPEKDYRRHLGVYYMIFSLPPGFLADTEAYLYNEPGLSVLASGYRDRGFGGLNFLSPEIDYDYRDTEAQRKSVLKKYAHVTGWRTQEILDILAASEDFYFDSAGQIHMDRWSKGRVVLLGDAAFAPSFFSGRGTALAMIGADILAAECAKSDMQLEEAFARYEEAMRPLVESAQGGVPETRTRVIPATWEAIDARNREFPPVG
ncbi:FAD-dependent monooxygenase [Streptomyces sp. NPDC054765]